MRCMACGGEMILMNVVKDDTMEVPGFEHHTFTCSECRDIERRLVFTKHSREGDAEPAPVQAAPLIAPASTVQDEQVAPSVLTKHSREGDTEPAPVQAAPPIALASTVQDEQVARSGVLSRVVAKIRGH
jgi:hypothetical protein